MKLRRILVPLDGRRAAETALPIAREFAKETGGPLYLLRVIETAAPTVGAAVRHRASVGKAERYLAATCARLVDDGVRDISSAVWSGSAAAAIVKAAELIRADMIVMARSGATGSPRQLIGSVVERVLRATNRPVLVVTPADAIAETSLGHAEPVAAGSAPTMKRSVTSNPSAPGSAFRRKRQ